MNIKRPHAASQQISAVIELTEADLQAIHGGSFCPGSNGFPFSGNFSQGSEYNDGGNFFQGPGYNYDGISGNGYGNRFNELPPYMTPPAPCPYSY